MSLYATGDVIHILLQIDKIPSRTKMEDTSRANPIELTLGGE